MNTPTQGPKMSPDKRGLTVHTALTLTNFEVFLATLGLRSGSDLSLHSDNVIQHNVQYTEPISYLTTLIPNGSTNSDFNNGGNPVII